MTALSREDWAEINYLEDQIQETFVRSSLMKKQILIMGEGFGIPRACFPGEDGYNEIQYLKAQVRAIKEPKHVPSIFKKMDSQKGGALSPDPRGGHGGGGQSHVRPTKQLSLGI